MRLPIQDIQSATERLRAYFGLRGQVRPELDGVVSPTAQLQDLSSIQGRGRPGGVVATRVAGASPENVHLWLYNDPATSAGRRDIWLYHLEAMFENVPGGPLFDMILSWGQGDPAAAGGTLVAQGNTRDLRFDNGLVSGVPEMAARFYSSTTNLGLVTVQSVWRMDGAGVAAAGVLRYVFPESVCGLLVPPGWFVRFQVQTPTVGDEVNTSWSWREFAEDANPASP